MFKSGEMVADYIRPHDGGELDDDQIQPNGVDLKIDTIYRLSGTAALGDMGYSKGERTEAWKMMTKNMGIETQGSISSEWTYILPPGCYVVSYQEEVVEIPDNHVGFVVPRTRLLRSGTHLTSGIWQTGYTGRGEGALITLRSLFIGEDMKIGQMVFARASNFEKYSGIHQMEMP